jgi:hypothetical protein
MNSQNKPDATLYALDSSRQVFREEGRLDGYARQEDWDWVSFIDRGKRKPWSIDRDGSRLYVIVLAGYDHPDPLTVTVGNGWDHPEYVLGFDETLQIHPSAWC